MEGKWAAKVPTFLFIMIKEELKKKIEEVVKSKGYELFSVEWKGSDRKGVLLIKIDSLGGITLKDCEIVSKALSTFLDIEDPIPCRYSLEVSSPGIERPLRDIKEFLRFKGSPVRFDYEGKEIKGVIVDVFEEEIYIKIKNDVKSFNFDKISGAKLLGPWEEL